MELLQIIFQNLLSFVFILSTIVFIHEYGHYWVAKKCGVKIDSFSIGFGKEIFGWSDKAGVRWKVSLIPLGGYVKMFGDEGEASTPDGEKIKEMSAEEKAVAFHTQPLFSRFMIVLAGPIANFLLAIIILTGFFNYYGRPETLPVVNSVVAGSAAEGIGLQEGDKIIEIDGNNIEYKELGIFSAFTTSITETYSLSARTLEAVGQMITGARPADQISGILRIADYSGKSVEQGLRTVLWFMAILSINLGLVNLFPIPMLDGGHLFFYIIEGVTGKPLSEKTQEYLFRFGFAVLISLMLFATFNDLKHFNIF